jgi:hypothetical protein
MVCAWKRGRVCGNADVRFYKRERSQRERRRARQMLRVDPERVETKQRPSGDNWRLS